jgi:hypothetical protein
MIGEERKFNDLKYRCVASRATRVGAETVKRRLTRIGTISVHIRKHESTAVGVKPVYYIWARPAKGLMWDRLDTAVMRLL